MSAVIKSQEHISQEFDKQKVQIENLSKKNNILEQHVTSLHQSNEEKANQISNLEFELNDLAQYGRRSMIDIRGIPRCLQEDTDKLVQDVAKIMKISVTKSDIEISHRNSTTENAAIIVKFQSRRKRNEFFEARSSLSTKTTRDIGFETNHNIYINENLTPINGLLLRDTRRALKKNGPREICLVEKW